MKLSYKLIKKNQSKIFDMLSEDIKVTIGNGSLNNYEKISDVMFELEEEDKGIFKSAQEKQLFYMQRLNSVMHVDNPNYTQEYEKYWNEYQVTLTTKVPLVLNLDYIADSNGRRIYTNLKHYLQHLFLKNSKFNETTLNLAIVSENKEAVLEKASSKFEQKIKLYGLIDKEENVLKLGIAILLKHDFFPQNSNEAKSQLSDLIDSNFEALIPYISMNEEAKTTLKNDALMQLLIFTNKLSTNSQGNYILTDTKNNTILMGINKSEVFKRFYDINLQPTLIEISKDIQKRLPVMAKFLQTVYKDDGDTKTS